MTQVSPDMVEVACESFFTKRNWDKFGKTAKDRGRRDITAALTAALGDTHVIVPREPTEAMFEAGYSTLGEHEMFRPEEISMLEIYQAMIAAAPTPEQQT